MLGLWLLRRVPPLRAHRTGQCRRGGETRSWSQGRCGESCRGRVCRAAGLGRRGCRRRSRWGGRRLSSSGGTGTASGDAERGRPRAAAGRCPQTPAAAVAAAFSRREMQDGPRPARSARLAGPARRAEGGNRAGGKPAARWLHFLVDKLSPRERRERGGSKFKLLLVSGY